MPRPSQPILSRNLIFRTALAKLDRTGGFTIPEIAHKLGVSVSSLYHHVKGRADILEGIRGLMADWDATTTDLPWQEAFAKHPAAIPALVAQTITEQSVLNQYESLAAILSDAGFSSRSVVLSVSMIDALCLGSALDLGAPSTIWQRSDEHRSALQNAVDNATLGDDRAEQAFQLHLSLIIAGLTDLLSSDLESETTVP
jgi:AcrR family transcriptional regulator